MKINGIQEMINEVMEMQIAPLIDCVFLLLIYFMVSASLKKTEADLGISLPGQVVQSRVIQMPDEQIIEIDADGVVKLNEKTYDDPRQQAMPHLTALLIRYRLAADSGKTKALVTIQADDNTLHQRVIDVLNACAAAQIKNVTFAQ